MIVRNKNPLNFKNPKFSLIKFFLKLIKFSSYSLLLIVSISILSNKLALDYRISEYSSKITKILFGYNNDYMISSFEDAGSYIKSFTLGVINNNDLLDVNLSIEHDKLLNIFNESVESLPRNYYSADLIVQNNGKQSYLKTKVRGKGDRAIHYENITSMSFRSNLKGEDRLFGIEEFSIQNPLVRNYSWEYLISKVARNEGLLSVRSWQVNFSVNGDSKGIHTIEEVPSKETIEQQKRKNGPIFGIEEAVSTSLNTKLDPYDLKDWQDTAIYPYAKNLLYSSFLDATNKKSFSSEVFDFNEWAKYFAIMDIFGSYHGSIPKSVKFYFNPVIGKFQPILFDAHIGAGDFKDFVLLDFISGIKEVNCEYVCEVSNFFKAFLSNQDFTVLYLKYLDEYSQINFLNNIKDTYTNEFKNLDYEFYSKAAPSDQIFAKGLSPYFFKFDRLVNRQKMIQKRLEKFLDLPNGNNFIDIKKYTENTKLSIPPGVKLVRYFNFDFKGVEFNITEPTIYFFSGNTSLKGVSNKNMLHIKGPGMFIFDSKNTYIKDVIFESSAVVPISNRNLSGAINILSSNVEINNLKIINTNAEDAINIIDSSFLISKIEINSSFSDALDLDFSDGHIESLYCNNIGNDCLDISESLVTVGLIEVLNTQDKAISAGENSILSINNAFIMDTAIGLVSKDGSSLTVKNAQINNVKLPLAVFKKKPAYNEPILNIEAIDSDEEILGLFDKNSKVTIQNNINKRILSSDQIEKLLYGAVYGKATVK